MSPVATRLTAAGPAGRGPVVVEPPGVFAEVLNLLFPTECLLCGEDLQHFAVVRVCRECQRRAELAAIAEGEALCERCGDLLPAELTRVLPGIGGMQCRVCRVAPPEFERAVAFAAFGGEIRDLLFLLKFRGLRRAGTHLLAGGMAAAMLKLEGQAGAATWVIPVPLHGDRERARGFNQAAVLARAGVRRVRKLRPEWRLEVRSGVLERVFETTASYGMNPRERRASLRGAFRVAKERRAMLAGREVLLVDDVMTTGATARECARVLRRAGAAKVWVATLARTFEEPVERADRVAMWGGGSYVMQTAGEGLTDGRVGMSQQVRLR